MLRRFFKNINHPDLLSKYIFGPVLGSQSQDVHNRIMVTLMLFIAYYQNKTFMNHTGITNGHSKGFRDNIVIFPGVMPQTSLLIPHVMNFHELRKVCSENTCIKK